MIDLILLAATLILASFTAKLNLDKRSYLTIKIIIFSIVIFGAISVLYGFYGSDIIISISHSVKEFGIGYPYSWKSKTMVFKNEIIGCYYLVFFGMIAMTLIASSYEHKDMQHYRDKGKGWNIGVLVAFVFGLWLIFYLKGPRATGGSASSKLFKHVYNSEILLLGWAIFWLAIAIYLGKYLRVIFNKSQIGK